MALARYRDLEQLGQRRALHQWWESRRGLIEEILISDILVRVMAAIGSLLEHADCDADAGPVLSNVFNAHRAVRCRALEALSAARGAPIPLILELNRVRSITERWGDLLIGQIAVSTPAVAAFASNSERAAVYASESHGADNTHRALIRTLVPLSFHDALAGVVKPIAVSPRWNEEIAQAALACLRPDLFDSVGVCQSLWLQRMTSLADQTERVVTDLMTNHAPNTELLSSYEAIRDDRLWRNRRGQPGIG
jgi:hypothetical protein